MRRTLVISLAYLLVSAVTSPLLSRLEWSVVGLVLRAIEQLGFIGGGNSYWGQIDGVNIATHPYWLSIAVRTLAALLVHGPLLVLLVVVLTRQSRLRTQRIPRAVRTAGAIAVLGFVSGTFGQDISNKVHRYALAHGDAWGCAMDWPWRIMPSDAAARYKSAEYPSLCRAILDHGPDAVRVLLGVSGSLTVFTLLGLWRWPDDGVPRCARCRYPIEGLDECPECGTTVTPKSD